MLMLYYCLVTIYSLSQGQQPLTRMLRIALTRFSVALKDIGKQQGNLCGARSNPGELKGQRRSGFISAPPFTVLGWNALQRLPGSPPKHRNEWGGGQKQRRQVSATGAGNAWWCPVPLPASAVWPHFGQSNAEWTDLSFQ